jgi:glutathione synthase/RimK-type ligase-like ATP-grasp enzyme
LEPNTELDLSDFDDYVVVKPDLGSRGAEVKIKRKTRVRWSPPKTERAIKSGHDKKIVQQFIYTGKWPVSYRATTLFGKVLFAWRVEASTERRELLGPNAFRSGGEKGGGVSIASSGSGSRFSLCVDPDVLELGRRAHDALPDYPLLGIDMVRDAITGKLYVVELNSCGTVWHFSSDTGRSIQRDNGINFASQFDGLRIAAEALIEQVQRRAS